MNEYLATIVDELYQLGIREAVISPGSRSTPLSMFFCESNMETYLDIDERSAGFFALGIAKVKNRPVVLVCTSGSAAAHYYPAVIEAKLSRVPLIILTADRPPELQNVGAPQTINQNRMFGVFLKYFEELAIPDDGFKFTYPRSVMRKAYLNCLSEAAGPVQINVPIREPLVPDMSMDYFKKGRAKYPFSLLKAKSKTNVDNDFLKDKKIVIVCGPDAKSDYQSKVLALGERLSAPILSDPLSNLRELDSDIIIDCYDSFLKNNEICNELLSDIIILFGQAPVSKRLNSYIKSNPKTLCIQVDPAGEYRNPNLNTAVLVKATEESFIDAIIYNNPKSEYLNRWKYYQQCMEIQLEKMREENRLFEGNIICMLQKVLPENTCLVCANSMAIRDIDYFWRTGKKGIKIICNRGTNGIDGTVSTALGVSTNYSHTVLLTGDLAFIHDLNGLILGKTHSLNLTIILINNNGGGIFHYLPQYGKKYFDYLFSTSHSLRFDGLAQLLDIDYEEATNYSELEFYLKDAINKSGINLIEIKTNKEESFELHEKYTTLLFRD